MDEVDVEVEAERGAPPAEPAGVDPAAGPDPVEDAAPTDPVEGPPRIGLIALALPVLALVVGAYRHRWLSDDGLINVRVVYNLVGGGGYGVSEGVRAEAATSPLWTLGLALIHSITGIGADALAVWLGFALTVGGLGLALWSLRRRALRDDPTATLLPIGLLAYACYRYAWDFTTSGLENGLAVLWMAGVVATWRGPVADEPDHAWRRAALIGLGVLIRPDLALVSFVFLGSMLWPRPTRRQLLQVLGGAGALPVAYQIFRMGYFGLLVPNTALTKEGTQFRWDQGLRYLVASLRAGGGQWLLGLTAVVVLVGWVARRSSPRPDPATRGDSLLTTTVAAAAIHVVYVIAVGGDFMVGRMLLPAAFLLAVAASDIRVELRRDGRPTEAAMVALAALPLLLAVGVTSKNYKTDWSDAYGNISATYIVDERAYYVEASLEAHPTSSDGHKKTWGFVQAYNVLLQEKPGRLVILAVPGGPLALSMPLRPELAAEGQSIVVVNTLGAASIASGLDWNTLDSFGLADPLAAHQRLVTRARPGHEKNLEAAWYVAAYADPLAPIDFRVDPDRVAAARRALECGELPTLERATTEPLTAGRFFRNIVDAPSLTTFRFDPDPIKAAQELCGD